MARTKRRTSVRRDVLPSVSELERLKAMGYSYAEIGRMYGTSRQAVSKKYQLYGGKLTPREEFLRDHFPWKHIPVSFQQASPYRRMRDHGEYVMTWGVGMSEDKLNRLRSFYQNMIDNNVVLEYDPEIPPNQWANTGGWAYRKRRKSDGNLLIRVNSYTELTELGRRYWVIPLRLP